VSSSGENGRGGPRKLLGLTAEGFVAGWLEGEGYTILDRNYSTKVGEVDIIALKDRFLCFVEVRSRSSDSMGSPSLTVNRRKQLRIIKAAMQYIAEKRLQDTHGRFDVAAVIFEAGEPRLEYIPAAFDAGM
jgi:putative endonuclease